MEHKALKRMQPNVSTEERLATIEANQASEQATLSRIEQALVDMRDTQHHFITREEYLERNKHIEALEREAITLQKELDILKECLAKQTLASQNQVNSLKLDCKQDIYNVNLRVAYYTGGIAVLAVIAQFLMNKYL